jgi:hypothetical protein
VCWFVSIGDRKIRSYPSECGAILSSDDQAKYYFEWFWNRTITKIPGPFPLDFWKQFLAQATLTEPAILHSILALSSVHKRDIFDQDGRSHEPDGKEKFYLEHYSKAIKHLQPHLSTKDRRSARIALITCIVFVSLEYLRGRFVTAQSHLRNGLEILKEFQGANEEYENPTLDGSRSGGSSPKSSSSDLVSDSTDDWILEAFSRLQLLVDLFNETFQHRPVVFDDSPSIFTGTRFTSLTIAWRHLERLFSRILRLTDQANRFHDGRGTSSFDLMLQDKECIQRDLLRWREVFDTCRQQLLLKDWEGLGSGLLSNYHTMASVLTDACLSSDDESVFDSSTDKFLSLITQTIKMWKLRHSRLIPGHDIDMSKSTIDIGWIPPLYHTALKCRNHRIRLQAIKYIESAPHREGIWDSKIAACIARKVMEIEEGDFYRDFDFKDDFSLETVPHPSDLSIPTLPLSCRIHQIRLVLPDGQTDRVSIFYRRRAGDWEETEVLIKQHTTRVI